MVNTRSFVVDRFHEILLLFFAKTYCSADHPAMSALPKNIGFIGLGIMGYPMAQNLFAKLPNETTLRIYDISKELLQKFQAETSKDRVQICGSCKEVAESSVGG
jgi:ornithine cyclodeaminase/alanine dehydrogenase-like protein (mu-crystallin family)